MNARAIHRHSSGLLPRFAACDANGQGNAVHGVPSLFTETRRDRTPIRVSSRLPAIMQSSTPHRHDSSLKIDRRSNALRCSSALTWYDGPAVGKEASGAAASLTGLSRIQRAIASANLTAPTRSATAVEAGTEGFVSGPRPYGVPSPSFSHGVPGDRTPTGPPRARRTRIAVRYR